MNMARRTGSNPYSHLPMEMDADDNDEGDDFIMRQIRMQKDLVKEQDADLDLMSEGVGRLGDMALEIGKEIEMQNKMIGDLDEDMNEAVDSLEMVTKKTKELIAKSGGCKWFAIVVFLSLVLLILTLLVIYT